MKKYLNLNPSSIEKKKKKDIGKLLIVVYIILTILLLINALVLYLNNRSLKQDSNTLKSEIQNYTTQNGNYNKISDDIKEKKNFIDEVNSLNKNVQAWKWLEKLGDYVPKDLTLSSIKFDDKGIKMIGIANTDKDIAVFLANLQMSKLYKNASVVSIEKVDDSINMQPSRNDLITSNEKDKNKGNNNDTNANTENNALINVENYLKTLTKDNDSNKKFRFTISVEGVKNNEEK